MSNSANLTGRAKQGDVNAIATLINHQVQAQGIKCKAILKGNCLQILLESETLPPQDKCVNMLKKGLLSLKPANVDSVKVFGKRTGEDFPGWNTSFEIVNPNPFALTDNYKQENSEVEQPAHSLSGEFKAYGKNGTITLRPKRLIVSREGFFGFLAQGVSGVKEIPLKNITAIQFKECGDFTVGFLQWTLLGSIEAKGGVFNAVNDENTVSFEKDQEPNFQEIKRFLDAFIDGEPISIADLQFTESRVSTQYGLVTQDEFEKLKAKSNERKQQITHHVGGLIEQVIEFIKGIFNGSAFKIKVNPEDRIAVSNKKNTASLLALFLGVFGAHKFFLGYYKEGLMHLAIYFVLLPLLVSASDIVSSTLAFMSISLLIFALVMIPIFEAFIYVRKSPSDFAKTYLKRKKGWF